MISIGIIEQATKKERTVIGRMVEGQIRTESQETGKRINIHVECTRNIHTEFYLNAQSF